MRSTPLTTRSGLRGTLRLSARWRQAAAATALLSVVVPVAVPGGASAQPVDDQRRRVESLADELERMTERLDSLAEDYVEAIALEDELSGEIADAQAEVSAAEAQLAQMRGTLYLSAVTQFMHGGRNSTLTNLLASNGGLQDALQRSQLTSIALNQGSLTTDSLDATATELTKKRKVLERKRAQAESVAENVLRRQGATEELAAKFAELKNSAQGELAVLLREEQERRNRLALEEAEREANSFKNKYSSVQAKYRNIPKVSARSQSAIRYALSQLGTPYRYAMSSPGKGFDCSGLTAYAWGKAGVSLPRNSRRQYNALPKVPKELAQPGDLVFTGSPIHHVGIYLGGGRMVHAPQTGDVVKVGPIRWWKVVGVVRPG
ncbi:MAG: NlpC/P60 family protein [Ilumatobacteraceae bacterium]